ncbi:MAG: T9SS type A sorting domain-containing protein [Bacteroidia bacterium]
MKSVFSFVFALLATSIIAAPGDTTKIISHNAQTIITNPLSGSNEYKNWVVFPNVSKKFRKVYVTMQYKCPSGMSCGAWDYIDQIMLRRVGGKTAASKDMEIVRYITPYGNTFSSAWKFQWHMDVTDYQLLLHDSVEVGYIHTGYEGTNVGWSLTLTFNFIEGTPVYEPVNITTLWDKNYFWTDVSDSTKPQTLTMQAGTNIARLRMNHTGHGADSVNGCSEFCPRYRRINIDGPVVDSTNVWRLCGANALYPQGGTWVYDRGGWCPGAIVYPYIFDTPVSGGSSHTFDMSVRYPYLPSNQGNEYVVAQLIECKQPQFADDASIEEVLNPSTLDEYLRFNPACARPMVVIKNNGTNPLTSLKINYALSGQPTALYNWSGNLATTKIDTVILPGVVNATVNAQPFTVYCSSPNGNTDGFKFDDTLRSLANKVTNYISDTIIIIETVTNNYGWETGYNFYNSSGAIIKQRVPGTLGNNTTYRDTVHCPPGCYTYKLIDTGGDGLSFWANTAQGVGAVRFRKISNSILRSFSTDFGSMYLLSFTTGSSVVTSEADLQAKRELRLYPNPALDYFGLEMDLQKAEDITIEVRDAVGKVVIERTLNSFDGSYMTFKTSALSKGLYFVNVNGKEFREVKKLIVE